MELDEIEKEIQIEPLVNPVPQRIPEPAPKREKVPAGPVREDD